MEEFHWLPQEIANIPYKTLQKLFIIQKQKVAAREVKVSTQKFKQQAQAMGKAMSQGRGQSARFTREL